MPIYLRKSCAFPGLLNSTDAAVPPDQSGSGGIAAQEFYSLPVKQSFTANRAA
jgi:hypothetical protein